MRPGNSGTLTENEPKTGNDMKKLVLCLSICVFMTPALALTPDQIAQQQLVIQQQQQQALQNEQNRLQVEEAQRIRTAHETAEKASSVTGQKSDLIFGELAQSLGSPYYMITEGVNYKDGKALVLENVPGVAVVDGIEKQIIGTVVNTIDAPFESITDSLGLQWQGPVKTIAGGINQGVVSLVGENGAEITFDTLGWLGGAKALTSAGKATKVTGNVSKIANKADDVANIAKISETAGKTAGKTDNIAEAAKTVKNTADNISKVEHNALTAPVKGGSYSQVKNANVGLGGETHHMPAKSVSRIPESKGPAVYLEKVDHKNTASYGNSFNAEHYRQIQKELIDQGKYRDAAAMDIWDIKKNTGTKYNEGLQQSIDYMKTLPEFKK